MNSNKYMKLSKYLLAIAAVTVGLTLSAKADLSLVGTAPFTSNNSPASNLDLLGQFVDTTGFNDKTWFDRAGNFHSDALHVVERYTGTSPDHLLYEATIEDPNVFTRPWKISMLLYRRLEKNAQIMEFRCVEFVEELMYGHLRKKPGK